MKNSSDILAELKKNKATNIGQLIKWKIEELNEMHLTYQDALSVLIESNDLTTSEIIEEKISQLTQAKSLKNKNVPEIQHR